MQNGDYFFFCLLYEPNTEKDIINKSRVGIDEAANQFQWNVLNGIDEAYGVKLRIINCMPIGTWPFQFKQLFLSGRDWRKRGFSCHEVGAINIPIIKQIFRYFGVKSYISKNLKENDKVLVYSTYYPFLKAIQKSSKKLDTTVIVTDLPEYYDFDKTGFLKRSIRNLLNKRIYSSLRAVNKFVVLTERMRIPLAINNRKYIVVEGISDGIINSGIKHRGEKKIILYAGSLHYKYGIKNLLVAFEMIDDSDLELWICGCGEAENEIMQLCENDHRVIYKGFVNHEKVLEYQQLASVLVNPRTNCGDYTMYSFPSKTMEYLGSGIPVIMYRLSGVPEEYYNYVFVPQGETAEDLKNTIVTVLKAPQEFIDAKCKEAIDFITKSKTKQVQGKRIFDLMASDP